MLPSGACNLQNCAEFWLDALSLSLLGFSFLVLWNLNWNIWPQGSLIHQNCQSDNSSIIWAHKNDFHVCSALRFVWSEKKKEKKEEKVKMLVQRARSARERVR